MKSLQVVLGLKVVKARAQGAELESQRTGIKTCKRGLRESGSCLDCDSCGSGAQRRCAKLGSAALSLPGGVSSSSCCRGDGLEVGGVGGAGGAGRWSEPQRLRGVSQTTWRALEDGTTGGGPWPLLHFCVSLRNHCHLAAARGRAGMHLGGFLLFRLLYG